MGLNLEWSSVAWGERFSSKTAPLVPLKHITWAQFCWRGRRKCSAAWVCFHQVDLGKCEDLGTNTHSKIQHLEPAMRS